MNVPPLMQVSTVVQVQPATGDYLTRISIARGESLGKVIGSILDRYVAGELIEWVEFAPPDAGDLFAAVD